MYLGLIGNCIQYINIKHANNTPQPKLPPKTAVSFKSFTSHIQRSTSTLKVAVWSRNKELKTRLEQYLIFIGLKPCVALKETMFKSFDLISLISTFLPFSEI